MYNLSPRRTRYLPSALLVAALALHIAPSSPAPAADIPALPRGHVYYANDFEAEGALNGWSAGGIRVADETSGKPGHALLVERASGSADGAVMVRLALPVEKMRGHLVYFSAKIRAEDISAKPKPYNGVKFMAPIEAGAERLWPSAEMPAGMFSWKPWLFSVRVPKDATSVSLCLGLESVTGRAWFDDVRVWVGKPPIDRTRRPPNMSTNSAALTRARLRGAMVGPNIDEEGLRTFGHSWNANLVRWQLIRTGRFADPLDLAAYDRWLESALKQFDAALVHCRKYGLRVVLDLHSPPGGQSTSGGYAGSDHGLFTGAACQRRFVELWREIAARYKGDACIWGFDLANEPVEGVVPEGLADWQQLADRAARAVRQVDPTRTLIVEPIDWGSPRGLDELEPLDLPNVVYSAHMYIPHAFTHQGVYGGKQQYVYPGVIEGRRWDKAALEAALQPVVDFQKAYGVPIYIGEFSAIRWAPDGAACRYLADLIDIFEAHGWDWSYHAFREWDGWSVEHGPDRNVKTRSAEPTDRERLLRKWYAKNVKPIAVDRRFGAERHVVQVGNNKGFVLLPTKRATSGKRPWMWYAPTFIEGLPDPSHEWLFNQLLEAGITIVGVDVGESYGNPAGRAAFTEFYRRVREGYGLDAKVSLLAQSRGGLMLYNWAAEHPDLVDRIAGIYPVCDPSSWPGLETACRAYNLSPDEMRKRLSEHNPVDRLAPLARAGIKLLHVHGDVDTVVPLEKNSGELARRYRALGGPMELIVVPGRGHQVCDEFFKSPALAKFLLQRQ